MNVPDFGPSVRFAKTNGDPKTQWSPSALPPLFEISSATKAIAYLAVVGPVSRDMLTRLRPGIPTHRTCAVLDRYAQSGLLISHDVAGLINAPRIWGLNRRAVGYQVFRRLCAALWNVYVERHFIVRPESPFEIPIEKLKKASGGPHVYRRDGFRDMGPVLHLMAELDVPLLQSEARRILNTSYRFERQVSLMVAQGLIVDEHVHCDRLLRFGALHPVGAELKAWLRYLNRTSFPEYVQIARDYRKRHAAGDFTWGARHRAGTLRKGRNVQLDHSK